MPPAGFEPAVPAVELPQTYALDHVATGIGGGGDGDDDDDDDDDDDM